MPSNSPVDAQTAPKSVLSGVNIAQSNLFHNIVDHKIVELYFAGHENYDSLKPYIAITDKTRKNLMTTMFSKQIEAVEPGR